MKSIKMVNGEVSCILKNRPVKYATTTSP